MTKPAGVALPTEIEEMGPNDVLSDEQKAAIEQSNQQDWIAQEPPGTDSKVKKEDPPAKTAEELAAEAEAAEKVRLEKEAADKLANETAEEKAAREAAEKAAQEENQRIEKKAKEAGKTVEEVKKLEADEKTENERLEKIAKEEGLSIDEVKENEAKDKSIAERHGNDPQKLARALRKEQSEFGKLQNEAKELRAFKTKIVADGQRFNEERFDEQMEAMRDQAVAKYKEKFPKEADDSEDVLFERAKNAIREGLKQKEADSNAKIADDAKVARDRMFKELPEEYKEFMPEIRKLINGVSDREVLEEEFNPIYIADMVRGRKYTPAYIKSFEEGAYKRGTEKSTIIPKIPASKPAAQTKTGGQGAGMTDQQKSRAEEIYGRREGWTKEKMWDEYFANDLKKDQEW